MPGPRRCRQQELADLTLVSGHDQLVDVGGAAAKVGLGIGALCHRERAGGAGWKRCGHNIVQHEVEAEVDGDPALPHSSRSDGTASATTGEVGAGGGCNGGGEGRQESSGRASSHGLGKGWQQSSSLLCFCLSPQSLEER